MLKNLLMVVALASLAGAAHAAESETFMGAAAASGTYKRPLLIVDGKRYELKASDKADASVPEMLAKFSKGDTGTYAVKGTRATVNGGDGILVDHIAPAAKPLPSTGAAAFTANAVQGNVPPPAAQASPTVTSRVVTVSNRKYTVYDYADPATKKFCVVIPEGLKTVRGLLVECNYAGGDSRSDWTFCHYYREFMHLHDFGLVASAGDVPHNKAFKGFRNCLQMVSVASHHPELVNAPYAAVGFSAGGGFASTLITRDPGRTIAAGIIEARYNFDIFDPSKPPKPRRPTPSAALRCLPGCPPGHSVGPLFGREAQCS
jgi:hypothetical protein